MIHPNVNGIKTFPNLPIMKGIATIFYKKSY